MEINRFDLLDLKKSPPDYIINEIEARNGESIRYIHETAIKAPCYIINAKRGERGLIMYLPDYDRDTYHRLHTSTVEDVIESVSGKDVIIMTKNTSYRLKRTNFTDTFRGVQKLGDFYL